MLADDEDGIDGELLFASESRNTKIKDTDAFLALIKAFNDYFGNFGYAFANVEARPEIDRTNNRVAFVLMGEPSRRWSHRPV